MLKSAVDVGAPFFHVWMLSGDFFFFKRMFVVLRILNSCKERHVRAPGKCHLLHIYWLLVLTAFLVSWNIDAHEPVM